MKPKVAVHFGGKSVEFDVSLNSATNVYNAIDVNWFEKELLGVDQSGNWRYNSNYPSADINLTQKDYFASARFIYLKIADGGVDIVALDTNTVLSSFNVAFPIIHGTLQGILRSLNVPFVGPDILGSALGMDKEVAKRFLRDADVPVAEFVTLYRHRKDELSFEEIISKLGLPVFVKPANAGSSVGVSKAGSSEEYEKAVSEAFRYDRKILVEEAVFGKEVECAVLGNEVVRASILGKIVTATNFYSYEDKIY